MPITCVIQKSRRRSLSVSVLKDCTVLVKAPYGIQERYVQDFLREKRAWILRQIEKQRLQNEKVRSLGMFSEAEVREIKKKARRVIPERVAFYAARSGISYGRVFIRLQKSRWGSCSAGGNLNFNCLLVLMPPEVLDSVVVHELVHRHHMNHSKAFYDEVISIFPDYKKWNKWLKANGGVFLARVPETAQ